MGCLCDSLKSREKALLRLFAPLPLLFSVGEGAGAAVHGSGIDVFG